MAFHKGRNEIVYAEVVSAPGLVTSFALPDQSKVWLNSNSRLRYPVSFDGNTRKVELEGEGYFEVESDRKRPFYVTTPSGMQVMAFGTRFNVNVQGNMTETILAEGRVALLDNDSLLKELLPGEEALFDNITGTLEMKSVNLSEKLAWKDGKIIFRNAPLDKVFEQLSKRYNVEIVFHDEYNLSEKYSSRRVTFTNETIQQILSYLEIAAPLEWKISPTVQNGDSTLVRQRIDVWLKKE
jgi:ferric-dicitrate binding protein FerR (iron transport regulator)